MSLDRFGRFMWLFCLIIWTVNLVQDNYPYWLCLPIMLWAILAATTKKKIGWFSAE